MPLWSETTPPAVTRQCTSSGVRRLHDELDHPVVHPDLIAGPEHGEELGMGLSRGAPAVPMHRRRRQREGLAGDERAPAPPSNAPSRTFGPCRSWRIVMGRPQVGLALADRPDHLAVLGLGAVGEVQARDVHARRDEPVEHRARCGWRGRWCRRSWLRLTGRRSARQRPREVLAGVRDGRRGGRPPPACRVAMTRPALVAALGAEVDDQSAVLMTSRLCSMITTVLPWSTSWFSTSSRRRMSAKCRPVVGSSRM